MNTFNQCSLGDAISQQLPGHAVWKQAFTAYRLVHHLLLKYSNTSKLTISSYNISISFKLLHRALHEPMISLYWMCSVVTDKRQLMWHQTI